MTTPYLIIDGETLCDRDLMTAAASVYFDSPYADSYVVAALDPTKSDDWLVWQRPQRCALAVKEHIESGFPVVAHNAEFEFGLINKVLAPRYGWPTVKVEQMRCTAALARANGLPGSLELAAQCLELPVQKNMRGRELMLKHCRPSSYEDGKPVFKPIPDDELQELIAYCKYDVLVTAALLAKLPPWTEYQQKVWEVSTRINQRGVRIDTAYAEAAASFAEQARDSSDQLLSAYTMGEVQKTTQTVALKAWINRNSDLALSSVAEGTLQDIESDSAPWYVHAAIEARLSSRAAAAGKYKAALAGLSEDGRFRDAFLPFGAPTTGRFSSRRLQLHNMRRDTSDDEDFHSIRTQLFSDDFKQVSLDDVARNVRRMIIPAPGNVLLKADWSQIEARVAPWLALDLDPSAGELLQVFRDGVDVYKYQASQMFKTPLAKVDKRLRFLGKVAQLSLGYQGGWRALNRMAQGNGEKPFPEQEARDLVTRWREANPWAVLAWRELERAAVAAVLNPGETHIACRCAFNKPRKQPFLYCRLPSGRDLAYPFPAVEASEVGNKVQLTYRKAQARPKKDDKEWPRTSLYGGKLLENVTQAVAADVLLETLIACEEHFLGIVLHVHDEPVVEVPVEHAQEIAALLGCIMEEPRSWAPDLPLAAEVQILERYK